MDKDKPVSLKKNSDQLKAARSDFNIPDHECVKRKNKLKLDRRNEKRRRQKLQANTDDLRKCDGQEEGHDHKYQDAHDDDDDDHDDDDDDHDDDDDDHDDDDPDDDDENMNVDVGSEQDTNATSEDLTEDDFFCQESSTTTHDFMHAVFAIKIKHSLSDSATKDIIKLCEAILPKKPNKKTSLSRFESTLLRNLKGDAYFHCSKCSRCSKQSLNEFKDHERKCESCSEKTQSFVCFDVASQLESVLKINSNLEQIKLANETAHRIKATRNNRDVIHILKSILLFYICRVYK